MHEELIQEVVSQDELSHNKPHVRIDFYVGLLWTIHSQMHCSNSTWNIDTCLHWRKSRNKEINLFEMSCCTLGIWCQPRICTEQSAPSWWCGQCHDWPPLLPWKFFGTHFRLGLPGSRGQFIEISPPWCRFNHMIPRLGDQCVSHCVTTGSSTLMEDKCASHCAIAVSSARMAFP